MSEDLTERVRDALGAGVVSVSSATMSQKDLERRVARGIAAGMTADEASVGIKDLIRYSVVYPDKTYASEVSDFLVAMRVEGFKSEGLMNNWLPRQVGEHHPPAIITHWRDNSSGQVFEVQLHTEASLSVWDSVLEMAAYLRIPALDDPTRSEIVRIVLETVSTVPVPPGAQKIEAATSC